MQINLLKVFSSSILRLAIKTLFQTSNSKLTKATVLLLLLARSVALHTEVLLNT